MERHTAEPPASPVDDLRPTIAGWNHYREMSRQGNTPHHNDAKYAVRNQWRYILDAVNVLLAEHDRLIACNRYLARTGCTFNTVIGSGARMQNGVMEVQLDHLPHDGKFILEPCIEAAEGQ